MYLLKLEIKRTHNIKSLKVDKKDLKKCYFYSVK